MNMKKIFFVISFCISIFSIAQTSAQWENIYGGPGNEYGYRVRTCLDQGYVVAGSTSSSGISDGYLVRVDSLGLVMWYKYYAGNNVDIFRSIKQLPDSGYIIAGYSNSTGTHGGYDGWVMRTDKNGDSLWSKYIGTSDWDFFYDVATTSDSGFILAGGTYGAGMGEEDMYFVKLDSLGNILWTKTYGGAKTEEARCIIETGDSMLAAVGFTYSLEDSLGDSWILRMNNVGDTIWTRTMNLPLVADKAFGIADCYTYNRLYIVGQTAATGNDDAYIQCINYSAASIYTVTMGAASHDDFYGICVRQDGTLGAVGTTFSYGLNGNMYFFKDRTAWVYHTFGTVEEDGGYSIDFTKDYGYIACGYTYGYNSNYGHPNLYLVKIDSTGFSSGVLNIREYKSTSEFMASTVFPNPIQSNATFTFDTRTSIEGKLHMTIYDISGRNVMNIPESQWVFNSRNFASCKIQLEALIKGIYTYDIFDDSGGRTSGKFVISN